MFRLYGREFAKNDLLKRIGDISQVCGIRRFELIDGNQKGVEALDIRTGSGLNFTVLVGRGMDISSAEYQGIPICWRSSVGEVSSAYFEPEGYGWLRSFFGGLLTTCGLTYFGHPCQDNGKQLGLHGRISNTAGRITFCDTYWQGDEYILEVVGKVRETAVFGEDILLTRKITTKLGETKLWINDVVENLGFQAQEHMILYHINIGFPIVDKDTKLFARYKEIIPRDEEAKKYTEPPTSFSDPIPNFKEKCYFYKMEPDKDGKVKVALFNKRLNKNQGLGIYLKYDIKELPEFIEWKMMGEKMFVVGIEPGNARGNRAQEREKNSLPYLAPHQKCEYHIEIGIVKSKKELESLGVESCGVVKP